MPVFGSTGIIVYAGGLPLYVLSPTLMVAPCRIERFTISFISVPSLRVKIHILVIHDYEERVILVQLG